MADIRNILGIEYPIIQGAMAWIADGKLCGSVSKAGGLGIIAAGNAPIDWVREQIRIAKSITDKPFAVNIMLMSDTCDDVARLVIEENVKCVTTGAGSPAKYMEDFINAGIKVMPVIPSSALAKRMEKCGATAVIAEGMEAGGHIGQLTTMALMPSVVDAVDIPVICAGGIADGRGMAAAYCLGASGVQVGTRFLVADECSIHEEYKNKVLKAKETDTVVTGRCTGHPVRCLKNRFAKSLLDAEKTGIDPMEFEHLSIGSLKKAVVDGDVDGGSFMAGQIAGIVKETMSAKDIILDIYNGAKKISSLID